MNGNVYINHGHGKKDKLDNGHRSHPKMKQIDEDIPDHFDYRRYVIPNKNSCMTIPTTT